MGKTFVTPEHEMCICQMGKLLISEIKLDKPFILPDIVYKC
jgi:hypothetical protein